MLVSKDNDGKVIGWTETYLSDKEMVIVNVLRNFSTISKQDRTTGKWESKTYFGTPPVPGVFEAGNRRW
jgi:hypothetical protein